MPAALTTRGLSLNLSLGLTLSLALGMDLPLPPPLPLGMDLLRLALERGTTAADAARICGELLEVHGQGGACAEGDDWSHA